MIKKSGHIKGEYRRKATQMGEKIEVTEDEKSIWEAVQESFYSGNVLPLVLGCYGEALEEVHKLLKLCTNNLSQQKEAKLLSSECSNSGKDSARNLILNKFLKSSRCSLHAYFCRRKDEVMPIHKKLKRSSKVFSNECGVVKWREKLKWTIVVFKQMGIKCV